MTELIIGELYKIKYSNVIYDQTFKFLVNCGIEKI